MEIIPLVKGLLGMVPGTHRFVPKRTTHELNPAAYYYGVWLKHLTMLSSRGMNAAPDSLIELGPGDSLGAGMTALLSGTNHYCALDSMKFADPHRDLDVFDELLRLIRRRAPRPTQGWPDIDGYLGPDLFPSHVLTEDRLREALSDDRVQAVRTAMEKRSAGADAISFSYVVPWEGGADIPPESADMILSHAVMEHVSDLEKTYTAMKNWLKPGGWMSHQVDFKAHGFARTWNGHWAYSDRMWKIVRSSRHFAINREPCSVHLDILDRVGFEVVCCLRRAGNGGLPRERLVSPWNSQSDEDFACAEAFIIARKRD